MNHMPVMSFIIDTQLCWLVLNSCSHKTSTTSFIASYYSKQTCLKNVTVSKNNIFTEHEAKQELMCLSDLITFTIRTSFT